MKKDNKVVSLRSGQKAVASSRLPENPVAQKLFEQMLDGYEKYKKGTKGNTEKSVNAELSVIKKLNQHSNKYPWEWRLDDWDQWNVELRCEKGISAATQRKNQGCIKNFLKYLVNREVFQREVKQKFNTEIRQIIDEDEALHHIYEREQKTPRPAFTEELSEQFFDALTEEIRRESVNPTRKLLNLQRDLAFFYSMKATGLRVGSTLALNIYSFSPNPKAPEMGQYGALLTTGKGSKGSGPKVIDTLIDDVKLPGILEWYITEIRPWFVKPNNPDEEALFMSERGKRLSYASAWDRLQKRLDDAGLSGRKLCNHSFRHGKATEGGMRYGVETTRRMLGHEYGTTTQGYMSVSDEFSQKQITDHIKEQIARSAKKKDNKDD